MRRGVILMLKVQTLLYLGWEGEDGGGGCPPNPTLAYAAASLITRLISIIWVFFRREHARRSCNYISFISVPGRRRFAGSLALVDPRKIWLNPAYLGPSRPWVSGCPPQVPNG
ncbi:hypothetical protein TNCV_3118821 [Trichonephila clavipes]|uniref:Uncharacterized protein n=1 Tax=Trichonephila clavipes TaxID=2585209 RepID=A0A8X7BHN2_TRICX|nr:hypothetical protein TNCV_3118821 [Trichonephila clavipes]